jgi:bifunctional UDP-N-acetylglucosamine pyrophosphorylase/glucosamine-1-phosphate N-acetyltransferase
VPFLKAETLKNLVQIQRERKTALSFLTTVLSDPTGYGRIVRTADSRVIRIVEERDAALKEKDIREINGGIYCVRQDFLYVALAQIGRKNNQGEYYLTDLVEIASSQGLEVVGYKIANSMELLGINTPEELAGLETLWTKNNNVEERYNSS